MLDTVVIHYDFSLRTQSHERRHCFQAKTRSLHSINSNDANSVNSCRRCLFEQHFFAPTATIDKPPFHIESSSRYIHQHKSILHSRRETHAHTEDFVFHYQDSVPKIGFFIVVQEFSLSHFLHFRFFSIAIVNITSYIIHIFWVHVLVQAE